MSLTRLIIAASLALALPAGAQDQSLRTLRTMNDAAGWEAVGRLDVAGKSFCTGSLIAPDLVLTAAHCLFNPGSGELVAPSQVRFLAGYRNGRSTVTGTGGAIAVHPDFELVSENRSRRVINDLALVRLTGPIRHPSISPFETATRPRKGAQVGLVSYARGRQDSAALQRSCRVLARRSGMLIMDCEVDFGASGSPVFSIDESGTARIVSVISSVTETDGRRLALGTDLTRPLKLLLSAISSPPTDAHVSSGPTIRRAGSSGFGDGAKFLRP